MIEQDPILEGFLARFQTKEEYVDYLVNLIAVNDVDAVMFI
ncbi:MAG TPA: hypothetical protein VGE40_08255 [Bacilli bacterium]